MTKPLKLVYRFHSSFIYSFVQYIQDLDKYSSSFNNNTKALYMLLKGTYAQFTGQLDIALKAYDSIPASIQAICLLGNLNSALIFQGNKLHDKRRAHEILNHIKPLCQSSNFTQLRFAWDLVNGSMGDDVLHSKYYLIFKYAEKLITLETVCYPLFLHLKNTQIINYELSLQ